MSGALTPDCGKILWAGRGNPGGGTGMAALTGLEYDLWEVLAAETQTARRTACDVFIPGAFGLWLWLHFPGANPPPGDESFGFTLSL